VKRYYISADMEGTCGIADWKETELTESQGSYFRAQMTREARAACEAALEAGADEIVVKDAHDSGRNIDPSLLPEQVRIIRAWTQDPLEMVAGIDGGFDGVLFVGYHSAAATDGNPLAHTMNTQNVEVVVNGQKASEFMINSYAAALFGVPVVFLSGDKALCEGAAAIAPGVATVPVSEGFGAASLSIHPKLAAARIKQVATAALRKPPAPLILPVDFELSVRFRVHHKAARASHFPGARKLGPDTVGFSSRSWKDALTFLFFVL